MVKIETIKKDLERYFTNKDGKEMSLYKRPLEEIIEGLNIQGDQIYGLLIGIYQF